MNWQSAAEFWAMGGYGLFVWSSFGLCLAVFALELLSVQKRNKRAIQRARAEAQSRTSQDHRSLA
jgi:heme exporter protein D